MSAKHSTFRALAVPVTPLTVGVTVGMVLLLVAAFAPVPAVWVLVLYVAGMAAAAAGVLVQRRRVRR
ncbi:hypothetical protein [Williamsia sp. D3]|uniref:hypothetical protein n=1 Tax=Williamsia sp. D3 TaxID=1313067 RepID=UPI0003D39B13|nr:hypothetical protein [Williamsia sp. D3]ETD30786.1 hypothetical protein W823_22660 [Williamsia sp. D3]PZU02679.1 MAG: hypothetical protein DI630_07345 [Gordonia sp. (in: high G+C Gram-positive bacteria)]